MASLPTAANILSSLGIKGATVSEAKPGFVPVLDANGKLSANLIPAVSVLSAVPPISDVAFVDPYTVVDAGSRNGSIAAPFKSISEAAASFSPTVYAAGARCVALMLAPGEYADGQVAFATFPSHAYLIGLGECEFTSSAVAVSGISAGGSLFLQNIVTGSNGVSVLGASKVVLLGKTYIYTLTVESGATVMLSSDSRVESTNAAAVEYLSDASRTGNTSSVPGGTVKEALDRLDGRRVRVLNISGGNSGIGVGSSSSWIDLSAESSGAFDVYDLRSRDRIFVTAINKLFQRGNDIDADTVAAHTVEADIVKARSLQIDALALGGYSLEMDAYGYLVVVDGSDAPPQPPDTSMLIRDEVTGALYTIGVRSGRMYVLRVDDLSSSGSSSSSSSPEVPTMIDLLDSETGEGYEVTISDGRLVISRASGSTTEESS